MSRYQGPRFKKICRLGDLPGLTNKKPRNGSDLRNQSRSEKKSQYRIRLEEKQKLKSLFYEISERSTGVRMLYLSPCHPLPLNHHPPPPKLNWYLLLHQEPLHQVLKHGCFVSIEQKHVVIV